MKRKKIIRIILVTLLVVIAGVALYIYKEYNRKPKDLAGLKPKFTVSAVDFIKEFSIGEKTANEKYLDKIIEVNGIVKESIQDEKGFYTIVLGDTLAMSSVRCSMDSIHNGSLKNISAGNNLSIKGICTGYNADELLGSDVILNRAVINNKKQIKNN
jgi:tRNA_anti-like